MTETAFDTGAQTRPAPDAVTPVLFALAIFTSAALVFVVQPMVTKLVLPMLGGSPSVWNTAMVFFQTALLAGYAYAHGLQRIGSIRIQVAVHLGLLLAAAFFLPLTISGLFGDPDPNAPIGWLLATLALSVGAPFAVLSATAPLLQAWYARVRAGHADGENPYVLYAASNLGSFLALLAYPLLIEPLMSLSGQRVGWSAGYGVFVALVILLAALVWRRRVETTSEPAALARSEPIPWIRKGLLVLLAAAPSSLMLGVTSHLSTDVASAPFLWVMPLALYLLTFVIAFQTRPAIPLAVTLPIQAALIAATITMVAFRTGDWTLLFFLNLAGFFFSALMCHQLLARLRPAPDRLTEFYLLMSLGGVVGGAFTALLAPVIFDAVWEYPLVLVLVCLLRLRSDRDIQVWEVLTFVGALILCATPPLMSAVFKADWDLAWKFNRLFPLRMEQVAMLILGGASILGYLVRDRRWMFAGVVGAVILSGHYIAKGYDAAWSDRSFFGVLRVGVTSDPLLGGPVHVLMHGTTLHGSQPTNPVYACTPTLYYAPATPIGQAAETVRSQLPGGANIGVVGLGSGAMAAYKRQQDTMTFFEIDPLVDRVARDPSLFTFINGCADGPVRTVLGDARLTMAAEQPGSYDLLLIDAFSSDAVPTHLLTVEAIEGYLNLLKPDGVVVLHLSNRNLDITRPAVAAARALGKPDLHQIYQENDQLADMAEASTEALVIANSEAGLAAFQADPRWRKVDPESVRPWTDDYVNLFGSLWRQVTR
ncbi:fused MFS/spermidine synthase [Brevundimonas variabilis]|uniref:SAM-dependent methyltransferase n=1 Tax=Brevundimonas variabilis TaxID=74312 RepID=A0A7W9CH90_9CAUL|nr:fused MFS/spermidine synthase [Brevundimonas variabilis]MBB5745605.1 SAM-dependent methyltransferase [Brevundimonas variabilis]